MSNTAIALLGYAGWTLGLILLVEIIRVFLVVVKGYKPTSFKPDGVDVSPAMSRLCRAHANCVENFPIVGGLLILALVANRLDVTESTALYLLSARVCQSLVHIVSGSAVAVNIRFTFYAIQLAIALIWVLGFIDGL